jgi:hypothetical protein
MLEQLVQIAELIGLVVITCTLIFIALQVKQGADTMRSEARQTQTNLDLALVSRLVEFPEIGRVFSQNETPTFEEKTQLMFWMIGQLRTREHEWLQLKSGALDQETWESYRGVIFFVLGTPRSRELWNLTKTYFNPDFVKMVDDMMQDVPPIDYWDSLREIA